MELSELLKQQEAITLQDFFSFRSTFIVVGDFAFCLWLRLVEKKVSHFLQDSLNNIMLFKNHILKNFKNKISKKNSNKFLKIICHTVWAIRYGHTLNFCVQIAFHILFGSPLERATRLEKLKL